MRNCPFLLFEAADFNNAQSRSIKNPFENPDFRVGRSLATC